MFLFPAPPLDSNVGFSSMSETLVSQQESMSARSRENSGLIAMQAQVQAKKDAALARSESVHAPSNALRIHLNRKPQYHV